MPAEELANESRSTHITVAADMVFSLSHYLSGVSVRMHDLQASGSIQHLRLQLLNSFGLWAQYRGKRFNRRDSQNILGFSVFRSWSKFRTTTWIVSVSNGQTYGRSLVNISIRLNPKFLISSAPCTETVPFRFVATTIRMWVSLHWMLWGNLLCGS